MLKQIDQSQYGNLNVSVGFDFVRPEHEQLNMKTPQQL